MTQPPSAAADGINATASAAPGDFGEHALNDSASWNEEIARYLLICTVFVGAAVCVRKNNHIQVDFFYRILPKKLMRVMATLVDVIRVVFFAYAIWLTWGLMGKIGGQQM